jgi:hypothetical protein
MHIKFCFGKPEEKIPSEDLGVDARIILKCVVGKCGWRVWIGFIWLRIRTGSGFL